jgi:sarcinarray family protein
MKMTAGIGKHGILVFSCVSIVMLIFISISGIALAKPIIKAYFNGQEATVENVTLKVDEPFTVDLNITPDTDSIVSIILMEPGNSRSYKSLGGNVTYDFIDVKCKSGETCRFHWSLAANGDWTEGTAPVNIYYQLNDAKKCDLMLYSGEFTVVDPYISPAHYTAAGLNDPDHPKAQASIQSAGLVPIALLAAFLIARKYP